jgi:phosphoglycolate phosphatase
MPSFDSLIFDLDGTLWDSTAPCARAWNQALTNMQIPQRPLTPEQLASIMGLPLPQIFETIFPNTDARLRESIARECHEEEIRVILQEGGAVYPGVDEGLKQLQSRYPLFIVSNCQTAYLEAFLTSSGHRGKFRDSECHGNTGKSKADNLSLLCTRNRLSAPVYIGDTAGDEEAARRAGIPYFHVRYGFGAPQGDCVTFDSFTQLVEFFMDPAI